MDSTKIVEPTIFQVRNAPIILYFGGRGNETDRSGTKGAEVGRQEDIEISD